ncbi:hypothetical protein NDI54_21090 [Haloarcula sp. S1AR25-5A]|uniref:Uncharacterized protein n=1 Tax=Haloarcula terrestris TaxID=2950533 RepID=A0AAE4F1H5_9EURY|nr:hypothetical protein [Haloarcula terrestris]MDS0223827.1 hypothetical protein [Haloarcula terrestris]
MTAAADRATKSSSKGGNISYSQYSVYVGPQASVFNLHPNDVEMEASGNELNGFSNFVYAEGDVQELTLDGSTLQDHNHGTDALVKLTGWGGHLVELLNCHVSNTAEDGIVNRAINVDHVIIDGGRWERIDGNAVDTEMTTQLTVDGTTFSEIGGSVVHALDPKILNVDGVTLDNIGGVAFDLDGDFFEDVTITDISGSGVNQVLSLVASSGTNTNLRFGEWNVRPEAAPAIEISTPDSIWSLDMSKIQLYWGNTNLDLSGDGPVVDIFCTNLYESEVSKNKLTCRGGLFDQFTSVTPSGSVANCYFEKNYKAR